MSATAAAAVTPQEAIAPRVVPGSKELQVVCATCTFINAADATVCAMCGADVKPPTHDIQANGSWKCGGCATVNRKGGKECSKCKVPFYSVVTSAAPSQIFCPQCGFLNDGENLKCVQCDITIRSTLEKLGTDLRDSTNFLARDMGVNINVKCPGCMTVCFVPPATACLRCGTCHTYFASPTVGEVTNFHMSRLASSISSSFMGLFNQKRSDTAAEAKEAPVGKMIALGDKMPRSPLRAGRTRTNSASFRSTTENPLTQLQQKELAERERMAEFTRQEEAFANMHNAASYPMAVPSASLSSPSVSSSPSTTGSSTVTSSNSSVSSSTRHAVRPASQDLVKVEGEIVEL